MVEVNRMIKQFKESKNDATNVQGDMNIPGMDQMLGGGVKGKLGKMAMNRMMKKNKKEEKEKNKQALVNYWRNRECVISLFD